jgi:hypothetical protein
LNNNSTENYYNYNNSIYEYIMYSIGGFSILCGIIVCVYKLKCANNQNNQNNQYIQTIYPIFDDTVTEIDYFE